MIAAWMAYALVVSAFFALAGLALEHGLRLARLPARWSVAAAMAASVLVPAVTREVPAPVPENSMRVVLGDPIGVVVARSQTLPSPADLAVLDLPLLVLWIVGAALILLVLIGTQLTVARSTRRCEEDVVHGVRVRRTKAFGPATVGCFRSAILLPRWIDRLDAESQRVVVLHEREHVLARDPQLQFAALVLTALQPWNLALWWQLRRLRSAIELDCDRRMLTAGVPLRSYGTVLLRMTSSRTPSLTTALAFARNRSFVARRIRTMTESTTESRYLRATAAACVAAALAIAGCGTRSPVTSDDAPGSTTAVAETTPTETGSAAGQQTRPGGVEYEVTSDGLEEVLAYLREARLSETLVTGTDAEGQLQPLVADLLDQGVLRAVPSSQDPLNVFFEDADGAPQGLMRVWVENGERRVQLFRAITVREGE